MTTPTPEEQLRFLANIQRLLSEGQFVATYKFALLLALADICVERGSDTAESMTVTTESIAEKFIQYYWPQVRPYSVKGQKPEILLQNTDPLKPPTVIRMLAALQNAGLKSLVQIQRATSDYKRLIREVRETICKMPLGKLQLLGEQRLCFLYDDASAQSGRTISHVALQPGVMFCLRRFYSLVTDIIRGAWVRYIRRYNAATLGAPKDLDEFLFGSERGNLAVHRVVLRDAQNGECFYCRAKLARDVGQVDHFIPWSAYPVDLGHNFVLAHAACNGAKSDHLAAERHLERWVIRNQQSSELLNVEFNRAGIIHDATTSAHVARWAYSQASLSSIRAWIQKRDFENLTGQWSAMLMAA